MVDVRIVNYVKQQMASGHDIPSIKQIMVDYGYDINTINSAISVATKKKLPIVPIIIGILGILIVIGLILIFAGDEVTYISPVYEEPVVKEPEPVEEEPEPIVIEPVEDLECPSSCDDFNKCTRDNCDASTGYVCANYPITPCCGNGLCEAGETEDNCNVDCYVAPVTSTSDIIGTAKAKAAVNPADAVNYCSGLNKESDRDKCHNAVSEQTGSSVYCGSIVGVVTRDNCYVDFALIGDYSVCDKITNIYLKQSCISASENS